MPSDSRVTVEPEGSVIGLPIPPDDPLGSGGTDSATVTIVMPGANDPPSAEDNFEEASHTDPMSQDALVNDSDPEGDPLTVTEINGSSGGIGSPITLPSGSTVTLESDGTYVYNPDSSLSNLEHDANVTETFEYTISDGKGGTDIATVTIVVHGNNTIPAAEDDLETTFTDMTVSANVLPNDSDPEADELTVTSVDGSGQDGVGTEITLASGAKVTLSLDGDLTYDPNGQFDSLKEGETGVDTFPYVITDGHGGYATATVTILMPAVNDAPDAVDDSTGPSPAGESMSDSLFSNDGDPEGDPLELTNINGETVEGTATITLPSGAVMTVNSDGEYTYDPNSQYDYLGPGETALETFEYTISDGAGGTDSATVTITVTGSNDVPDAVHPRQAPH